MTVGLWASVTLFTPAGEHVSGWGSAVYNLPAPSHDLLFRDGRSGPLKYRYKHPIPSRRSLRAASSLCLAFRVLLPLNAVVFIFL